MAAGHGGVRGGHEVQGLITVPSPPVSVSLGGKICREEAGEAMWMEGLHSGQKWWLSVGQHATGPGRMGVSRWLPPLPSPSPQVGKHTGVLWVRPHDRVGLRVAGNGGRVRMTCTAGLRHVEVGSPVSPWLPGACGHALSP